MGRQSSGELEMDAAKLSKVQIGPSSRRSRFTNHINRLSNADGLELKSPTTPPPTDEDGGRRKRPLRATSADTSQAIRGLEAARMTPADRSNLRSSSRTN